MTEPIPDLLQELLDRGVDPLDDPRARQWLLDHPEALESFAALRATLGGLPRTRGLRRWRFWLHAASVAVAVAAGLWLWLGLSRSTLPAGVGGSDAIAPFPRPTLAARSRIVEFQAVTTVDGPQRGGRRDTYRATVTAGRAATLRRVRLTASRPSPLVPLCTAAILTEENVLP